MLKKITFTCDECHKKKPVKDMLDYCMDCKTEITPTYSNTCPLCHTIAQVVCCIDCVVKIDPDYKAVEWKK